MHEVTGLGEEVTRGGLQLVSDRQGTGMKVP